MEHITDNLVKLSINNNKNIFENDNEIIFSKSAYKTGNKEFHNDAHSQQFTVKDLCEKYDLTDRCVRSWFKNYLILVEFILSEKNFFSSVEKKKI